MDDLISRQAAIDAILAIKDYGNSDRANALGLAECAVTTLPSVQPEQIARDIATIIENEKDMRVVLKNERTETHSCDYQRTGTHEPQRMRGKWIDQKGGGCCCSECGGYALDEPDGNFIHVAVKSNYCPNCGADMRGTE